MGTPTRHVCRKRYRQRQNRTEICEGPIDTPTTKINWLEDSFQVGVILKGVDGVLEIIGGLILLFVGPTGVSHFITTITQYELSRDPHDFIATHILNTTQHLAGAL